MNYFKFRFLFVVALLAFDYPLNAQFSNLKFDRIGLENGLSQSTVNAVVQDAQGFIWFGTDDGLNRYDGYSIAVFKHSPDDSSTISDNTIRSLLSDRNGNLWIGTLNGGLNRYVFSENRFYHYKYKKKDSSAISGDFVTCLFEDSDGDIWIGTDNGLNFFGSSTGSFIQIFSDETNNQSLSSNSIWAICEDHNKNLWIATSKGLSRLDLKKEKRILDKAHFVNYSYEPSNQNSLSGNNVHSLFVDKKGILWIGTWGSGLNSFNTLSEGHSFRHYFYDAKKTNSISSNSIQSIYEDSRGNLWLASYDAGLMMYDPLIDGFVRYSDEALRTLYEDRSGILWIGTFASGIKLFDQRKNFFSHYFDNADKLSMITENIITSIFEDSNGDLWAGTYGSGLKRYTNVASSDKKKGHIRKRIKTYSFSGKVNNTLSSNKIMAISELPDGTIWIGTEGGGLNRFDKNSDRFIHYKHNPGNLNISSDLISSLYFDGKKNVLWIGYLTGGIDYYDPSTNKFKHFTVNDKNLSPAGSPVTAIYRGKQSGLWIGTLRDGLYRLVERDNIFKRYWTSSESISNPQAKKNINNNGVFSIYEDDDGIVWIGTYGGGLNRYDFRTNSFTYFTEQNGLPNNVIYGVLPDKSGNLWLSTNKGLSRFNFKNETFRNYDVRDGLQANEFNQGAYFVNRDGELFFGGVNGFNSFLPEGIKDNDYIPPVYLTSFKIFDNPIQIKSSVSAANHLELSYSQNFFSFEFVALSYTSPEKNQFAYKLDGFDKDWHYVTALQRYGSYTNLDPGEYILRLKGSNNDGVWNNAGASINIIVKPPFWMTWWFRSIAIMSFLSAVFMIYRNRVRTYKKEKELQQEISRRLIEKQEEERRRIALEMHDSLGHGLLLIKNRANLPMKKNFDISTASENFNLISTAASEALKTVRQISHNLRPPELDQLGLTETLRSVLFAFRETAQIKVSGEVDNIDRLIPRELEINLVRILQEALSNISKHSGATESEIFILNKGSQVILNIKDNGIGFNSDGAQNPLEKKESAGLGLAGMNERIRILGGSLRIESNRGNGTNIEIIIPVVKEKGMPYNPMN